MRGEALVGSRVRSRVHRAAVRVAVALTACAPLSYSACDFKQTGQDALLKTAENALSSQLGLRDSCASTKDCKGTRVCESGACVDAKPAKVETTPVRASTSPALGSSSPSPSDPTEPEKPSDESVQRSFSAVKKKWSCKLSRRTPLTATVTFNSGGDATEVSLEGKATDATLKCVREALEGMHVPPFRSPTHAVRLPLGG
jgi:hypothetical protein